MLAPVCSGLWLVGTRETVGREFLIKLQVHKVKAVNAATKSPVLSHCHLYLQKSGCNWLSFFVCVLLFCFVLLFVVASFEHEIMELG